MPKKADSKKDNENPKADSTDKKEEKAVKEIKIPKEPNIWMIAAIVLAVLLLLSIFTNGFNPNCNAVMQTNMQADAMGSNTDEGSTLGECLTSKGAVMYGTLWCGHCQNQKKMFGDDVENIAFVDCDIESELCREKGVTGYPTWIINGQKYPGEKPLGTLAELAGCKI